ncbi:MAG: PAS domain S-box protein [Pirellulales bacterium]
MANSRDTNTELTEENIRLRAQVAQLEDKLDHLSEHGSAAKAWQETEALHRDVMSVLSDAALIADNGGRLVYVSPNAHFIFGYSSADILKQGRVGFLLPGDLFDHDVLEQRGEIANIECQIRDAVGRARNLLVTVRRVDRQGGTVLYACRDVTERKRIQLDYDLLSLTLERRVEERTQELRESRERYRRLVEGLRDEYLFYATDPQGVVLYISPSIHTILGRTPDQVIGHNWREFVDTEHATYPELEKLEQMRFAGLPTPLFSAAVLHANGETRIMEFTDAPVRDADGRVVSNEGIGRDITQRLQQEEALRRAHEQLEQRVRERTVELTATMEQFRESEHRYRSVVEDQLEFILRWRSDGVRTFVNDAYCRYCGATRDELIGESFVSTIVSEDRRVLKAELAKVSAERPVVVFEHRVEMSDGRIAWQHWSHRALFNQLGALVEYQSVGCDITERRRREEHERERATAHAQLHRLTDRERDVLHLVVAGDANKIIARKLDLSIKTIEKHRSSLMKKLHIRSVPELVKLALLADGCGEM